MSKPVVRYKDVRMPVVVGDCAIVMPADHPTMDCNDKWVETTKVLTMVRGAHGPLFETKNTHYKPIEPDGLPVNGFTAELSGEWKRISKLPRRVAKPAVYA